MIARRLFLWLLGSAPVLASAPTLAQAPSFPFVMMHPECGGPAFYLRCKINPGDLFVSAQVALLDGGPMPPFSPAICGSCSQRFQPRAAYIRLAA